MNQLQQTLNGPELNKIAHTNHTSEVTMTALALRQRQRQVSDLARIRNSLVNEGEKIVENDFLQFFKNLEKAGVGAVVYGRKNKPARFEWFYSLREVAKSAIEGTSKVISVVSNDAYNTNKEKKFDVSEKVVKIHKKRSPNKPKLEIVKNQQLKLMPTGAQKKDIIIPIRDGLFINISVPTDITKSELDSISKILASIS